MQRRTKPFTIPTLLSLVVLIVLASGWSWRGTLGLGQVDAAPRSVQPIVSEQARALALNSLARVAGGYELTNPGHTATFTRAGLRFNGRNGGPDWRWRLISIEAAGGAPLDAVDQGAVVPLRLAPGLVAYPRGGLVEQYVARPSSIEQQFIIAQPLDLGGADLVIAGAVQSAGSFETRPHGWLWRNADPASGGRGVVSLGDVRVFDADGRVLPARLDVTAQTTHLTVDGAALAAARYPVTIDPEVGTNDFRISDMGPNSTAGYEALESKVAYNSATKQYLVVWRGDDQADLQAEIYGQLVDATTGAEVGTNDFLIARIGAAGDPATDAIEPAVVYNSVRNEFLVVFAGDNAPDPAGPPMLVVDTFEIYAQRVAANGSLVGGQLRLSDMGSDDANGSYDARDPAITYNPGSDQYLVVWNGDDNTAPLINAEMEIFGQLVGYSSGNLVEVGTNDFQISTMGPDGMGAYDAREVSVAYNSAASEYLVVWSGNDTTVPPTVVFEIYGQRLTAAGASVGTDDFLLGDSGDEAYSPDVSYNSTDNQYLVVWEGDNGAANDFEVYGQLLNGTGGEIGADFQISDAGPGSTHYAQTPAVAYNSAVNEYMVVWKGEDDFGGLVDGEFEAFGKRLNAAGAVIEGTLRLSNMGPNGAANSSVQTPDVAYSDSSVNDYLAVWAAENQPTTAASEAEIWGQLVALQADLRITKTLSSPAGPAPGEAVQYTVTYSNLGPEPVFNVVITDLVPTGVTSPSFSTSGVTGSAPVLRGGTTYIWDVARLNSGQGGTITINGTVGALANGTVVGNTASIATTSVIVDTNAGNGSQTANFTVNTPPTVAMSSAAPNPTNTSPIPVTAQFSENVTGFIATDIVAGNATVNNFIAVDGDTYTFNLVPSGQGLVTADIAAGVALDSGGKGNLAATQFSRTFDSVAPTVTINQAAGQADPTTNSPINFTVVFGEAVSGFSSADVSLSGTAGATTAVVSGSGPTYNVAVSGMTTGGTVIATIGASVATDAAGNGNSASTSTDNTVTFVVDSTAPTVAMSSAAPNPTNSSPIAVTAQFSENVTGFIATDIVAGNATVNNFVAVDGDTYTFNLVPSGQGLVTADIAAGVATDAGGNPNTAATQFSRTYDSIAPTVTINQAAGQADPTTSSPINFTVVFGEAVSGFSSAEVTLSGTAGATTAVVSGSGPTYNVAVSGMTTNGTVIATIGAGVASDAAGNGNSASTSTDNTVTFIIDNTQPSVAMSSAAPNPTNISPIAVTTQFSENVTGFTAADITTSNGTVNNFVAVDGDTYTFDLVPTGQGLVTADIAAGVAVDGVGNLNTAATQFSRTYDSVGPTVTIDQAAGQADPTAASPVNFTVVFGEAVSDFTSADVTVSGTAGATTAVVSGSGTTYNVAVTGMTINGTVIASIGAGVATDATGNSNSASTSADNTVTFVADNTQPSVAMNSAAPNPTNSSPIPVTAQFSKNVIGFIATDIVAGNATVNNFVAVDGDTYTFDLVPSGQGLVTADIAAGVATDVVSNPNLAAAQFSRTYDSVAPTVTINQAAGQADPTSNSPINFTVVFNESVTGFDLADVSLVSTAGAVTAVVSGSGTTYNVAVSGMTTSGTVTASILAKAATDAAGNDSTASTSTDNTVAFILNRQPVAADDSVTTNEDTAIIIDPFANDNDADGDALTVSGVTLPANGTVVVNGDGTVTYTPAPNFNGTDSFTYRASDGNAVSNTAIVTVTVQPVNDAPSFTPGPNISAEKNSGPYNAVWATASSVGPANESSQTRTFLVTSNSNPGLFSAAPSIGPNGTLTFTPAPGATGMTTIAVVLKDNGGTANGGVDTSVTRYFTITIGAARFNYFIYVVLSQGQ